MRARVAILALVTAALAAIGIAACGDEYGSEEPSSSSSGGSSSSSSGSASSSGGQSAGDSGNSSGATGPVSSPGKLDCGPEKVCDLATQICCIFPKSGTAAYDCVSKSDPGACNDNKVFCDEAKDCSDGKSCCGTLSLGKFETVCDNKCTVAQSCRSDEECGGSQTCIKQECTGFVSWLCGKNPFCKTL